MNAHAHLVAAVAHRHRQRRTHERVQSCGNAGDVLAAHGQATPVRRSARSLDRHYQVRRVFTAQRLAGRPRAVLGDRRRN